MTALLDSIEPADAAERAAIAERLDETLFVGAGAGTGKTTALVSRVVSLVASGIPMSAIAAITFTEAAAAQLRDRIRTGLEEAARKDPRLAGAAADVDDAAVRTLHAFAQRILTEHPLAAGLPPVIEVLDEIESGLHFEERWSAFVDALLDDPAAEGALLRAFATGLTRFEGLRTVALALHDHRDRLVRPTSEPPTVDAADFSNVLDALAAAAPLARHCIEPEDYLRSHLEKLGVLHERLGAAVERDELEALELLANPSDPRRWGCGYGQANNWPVLDVRDARAACDDAESARTAVLGRVKAQVLSHLLHRVIQFTLDGAAERRALGRLDFHDLLVEARDLLRARADVRAALRKRYADLLIDEFQDTDPIQVELAVLLAAREPVSGWREADVEPGRLFFVGDAKQSIYRFRRADIALYLEVERAVADAVLQLTVNFRSVPGIVAWVNAVFAQLIGGGDDTMQASYEPLVASRPPLSADAPVVLLGGPSADPLSRIREREADDIARTIVRAVEQESWHVGDSSPACWRPAHYDDVAILLPTRTSLPQLEAALEAQGVPYRVESASLVWDTPVVRDVLAVLRAIDDPTDEVSLVAALRSPAFACTDADLVEFHRAGGRWNLEMPCPESLPGHPVCGLDTLRDLHQQRWWDGVSSLVERVVRELRFSYLVFAHARPRDHWRRLRFVVDQARAFEEAGGRTLREFAAWAERQAADDARVREPVLPEDDDDAVRILTVHGAKGLEFPIVVLSGLNRAGSFGANALLWEGDQLEVRASGFETPGYAALKPLERNLDAAEQIRLLYVAATRARDHLVVSVHHKQSNGTGSQAAEVAALCDEFPELWRRLDAPPFRMSSPPGGRPPIADADAIAARQQWDARRQVALERLRRADVRAATAVLELGDTKDEPDLDAPPWRRGRAGTAIGRAVHATLQTVDLATGDGVAAIARAQAAAEGIDERAAEIERLARAALGSEIVAEAVATGRLWRELYVATPIGSTLIEGFVDLTFDPGDGQGLVIVDYKTDSVRSDGDTEAATRKYRLQLATYALALEATVGRPVDRGVLLFVSGGVARDWQIPDLAGAVAEVRARIMAG